MSRLELRVPPLVVVAVTALAMWLVARVVPSWSWPLLLRVSLALLLAVAGVAAVLAGWREFEAARTTVNPLTPGQATSIVRSGIYRYSRNPMYLGMLLLLAALGTWLANPAAFLLLPAFVAYIGRFQVGPEERALAARFGEPYEEYRRTVRRWL